MDGAIHPVQPKSRFTAKDTTGITTKTFTFTNTSSGYPKQARWSFTPNTVTYQNSTTETSLDSVQVKFTAAGTYAVKLWVQNPFGEDSLLKTNHITVSPIGGFEEFRSNPFTLYPIPATTELMVNGGEDLSGAVTLSIQNCLGEILSTETRLFTSNIPQVLNTSDIPQGLYLLSISYNNVSYTLKFVK
jgi:PKD repeat protein